MSYESVAFETFAADIAATPPPRLVAVDGRSGAGKTTFAAALLEVLPDVAIVRVDDFLYWGELHRWWPRLQREALEPLLSGRAARFRVRDWINDQLGARLGQWQTVQPSDTILIEGVTSSRRAIASRITTSFWIDAPAGERLRRGIERDGESMRTHWEHWMRLEDEFFLADDARARADHIIDGYSC